MKYKEGDYVLLGNHPYTRHYYIVGKVAKIYEVNEGARYVYRVMFNFTLREGFKHLHLYEKEIERKLTDDEAMVENI